MKEKSISQMKNIEILRFLLNCFLINHFFDAFSLRWLC